MQFQDQFVKSNMTFPFLHAGPKITIAGHKDHRVVFSPGETSGTFTVDVYTTSQLVAFRVQRSDGDPQGQQMLTEFVSYPSNSIVAKYRIGIPWMTEKLNGIYTISVTNNDGESATQTVKIEKAAGKLVSFPGYRHAL